MTKSQLIVLTCSLLSGIAFTGTPNSECNFATIKEAQCRELSALSLPPVLNNALGKFNPQMSMERPIIEENLYGYEGYLRLKNATLEKKRKAYMDEMIKKARSGDSDAQTYMGQIYFGGGITFDLIESFFWLKQAAQQGNIQAKFNLGQFYFHLYDTELEKKFGLKLIAEAAEEGDELAELELKKITRNNLQLSELLGEYNPEVAKSIPITQDYHPLIKKMAVSAREGNIKDQTNLCAVYTSVNDFDILPDRFNAIRWCLQAAKQGDLEAKYNLLTHIMYPIFADELSKGQPFIEMLHEETKDFRAVMKDSVLARKNKEKILKELEELLKDESE